MVAGETDGALVVGRSDAPSSIDLAIAHVPYSNMVAWAPAGDRARVWLFQSVVVRFSVDILGTRAVCCVAPAAEIRHDPPCWRVAGPDQSNRVKAIVGLQRDGWRCRDLSRSLDGISSLG